MAAITDCVKRDVCFYKKEYSCYPGHECGHYIAEKCFTSTNSAMVSASQISAAANQWADGNPNRFGVNGFLAGAEWMRQKLHQ